MIVLGLTGSMGSGKSTIARMFHRLGFFTSSSDTIVASLYQQQEIQQQIAGLLPQDFGSVTRAKVANYLVHRPEFLPQLEKILHPAVRDKHMEDIQQACNQHKSLIVLEIPLLFETNWQKRCDATVLATCPFNLRYERVMTRVGMTKDKFMLRHVRQWPEAQKRSLANFILDTSQSRVHTYQQVKHLLKLHCLSN